MIINNSFAIASSEPSQGRIAKINKDPEQQNKGQSESSAEAIVVAPDEKGTDNAKAYQQFIREEGNVYSKNAIASYTSFEKQQQRESIQSMFGVDIYA
ncbi:hypothetical protein BK026_07210 [Alteromonas sp. V450]|uniref:hypothetical protein n=1 Tax=Alteromonas sp. V450 TaxID=1912139 RepID=UPI0008FF04C9|nr:hypothetical protein [Alteromonas sp. V450]OJF68593.1 hypothetical protein BK026_07210 [Alteromonas sp. V450]|tara:strand:+ start:831 stop:1124 length:294 start_codon:yes stop_codon:yes gene_type:complete